MMKNESLFVKGLMLSLNLAAFATNVYSLFTENKSWVIVTALIYILPVMIEVAENLQAGTYKQKSFFVLAAVGFFLGIIYIVCIITFISFLDREEIDCVPLVLRILLILIPAPCVLVQAYPFGSAIMQAYNRQKAKFGK